MSKKKHTVNRAMRARRRAGKARAPAQKPQDRAHAADKPTIRIDDHPLSLAHARGKIDDIQFAAGLDLRGLCETLAKSGRDSTQLDGVRGSSSLQPWTDIQRDAAKRIGEIKARLGGDRGPNWIIARAFCGDGWSMAEAIRKANIPCHRDGVLDRVREALDALAGRERHDTAAQPKRAPASAAAPNKPDQSICAGCGDKLCLVTPIKSRLCELLLCLACYRVEAAEPGTAWVARYRHLLRDYAESQMAAVPPAAKRGSRKKVASAA